MKVGDIVRQNGRWLIDAKNSKLQVNKIMTGIVVEVRDEARGWPSKFKEWQKMLGASVTVLWSNGRITESMAESSLEIVDVAG